MELNPPKIPIDSLIKIDNYKQTGYGLLFQSIFGARDLASYLNYHLDILPPPAKPEDHEIVF